MAQLQDKYADNILAFIQSPIWAIMRYKFSLYTDRMQVSLAAALRQRDYPIAARYQDMIDAVTEVVKLTERLPTEVRENQLDVDAALRIIENQARNKEI